jgi:type VI secretion system secreted protein VgrG
MQENYLEENRFLFLESKLGANELLLDSFTGSEGISRLFSFQLELLSENRRIKFEDLLGQELVFGVSGAELNEPPRCFHGIVTSFAQLPESSRFSRYRAVVSPKLWLLTQKQNCRIFQNVSVADIIKKLLDGMDVAWELQGAYRQREYCVQYRETDFNFLSRLMEEEGIFYYFRHTKDTHKLVVSDSTSSHQDITGRSSLTYDEVGGGTREEACISSWIKVQDLGPGTVSLQDYFFENPRTSLFVNQDSLPSAMIGKISHKLKVGGNENCEVFDYPGRYENKKEGQDAVKIAMEQVEVSRFIIEGESNVFHLTPGYRFSLSRHSHADGSYVLTSVSHSASEGGFHSGTASGANQYANSFHAIPFGLVCRPCRAAVRPHVRGCQTAVVVGPSGEEIYTDKYGRVKVQFHWDREGGRDQASSCWIRVATHWAGRNWGSIYIPRIGQEVVVDFLEGDPDRPIIVGSVYNAMNMPPYELPADKTRSGILSSTSPGGDGFNQIRFEDKKGSEEIFIHAQKDMNAVVENDRTVTVRHDETIRIANNRETVVDNNDTTTVGKKMTITVKADRDAKIMGSDTRQVTGDSSETLMQSEKHTVGTSRTTTIAASDTLTAGGSVTITAGSRSTTLAATDILTAGGTITITAPSIILNAGMVQVTGVLQCTTLIASASVVSPSYTPGAGNMM